jgi:hypothetical protein
MLMIAACFTDHQREGHHASSRWHHPDHWPVAYELWWPQPASRATLQWTITTVEVVGSTLSGQGREARTAGQYITVDATVTNNDTQTVKIYPPELVGTDSTTYKVSDDLNVTLISESPCVFKDLAGKTMTPCRFVFETPKNIQPRILRLHRDYGLTPDIDLTRRETRKPASWRSVGSARGGHASVPLAGAHTWRLPRQAVPTIEWHADLGQLFTAHLAWVVAVVDCYRTCLLLM